MPKALAGLARGARPYLWVVRNGVEVTIKNMIIGGGPFDRAVMYQYLVGFAYLIIGLFVYFRRGSAHKARHFYIFCLSSFIFFCFHYTGKLNTFDKVIYYGNVAAGLLAPDAVPAFLPDLPGAAEVVPQAGRGWPCCIFRRSLLFMVVYGRRFGGACRPACRCSKLRWMLDRAWMLFATLPYLLGGWLLRREYRQAEDPIVRQQLQVAAQRQPSAASCRSRCCTCCRMRWARPELLPEDVGALAGADPADAGLRHRALPADGRGHHFPPRLCLHAGHDLRAGGLLRARVLAGQRWCRRTSRTWATPA